jgi:exodeoxyribonuclease VII large subunit
MAKIFTVTELTKIIKGLIESNFNLPICVNGEISSLSFSANGHCYFILKDEFAQIKVAYFKSHVINNASRTSYIPKNGDNVEVIGNVTVYEKGGEYQIIARTINYSKIGEFYRKYEETKRKLEEEGFFDKNIKKLIPLLPKRIAVLTSIYGAAIKDFIKTSEKNFAKYTIDIWPVQVQGMGALNDIVTTLNVIEKYSSKYKYDLIVLMRGGGSLEDLAIFNDEAIARALTRVSIPVMTAIGHERDITICDLVADKSVSTPTQAAMILSQPFINIIEEIENYINIMKKHMTNILHNYLQQYDFFMAKLNYYSPSKRLESMKDKLEFWRKLMIQKLQQHFIKRNMLVNLTSRLQSDVKYQVNKYKDKIDSIMKRLYNVGPENVLKRGYAIVMKEKRVVSSVKRIELEDELEIRLYDGYINSFVTAKKMQEVTDGTHTNN